MPSVNLLLAARRNALSGFSFKNQSVKTQLTLFSCYCAAARESSVHGDSIPFRKQLKDEAKSRSAVREKAALKSSGAKPSRSDRWELTVGIEVHAQLNTDRKLFSSRLASPLRLLCKPHVKQSG